MAIYQGSNFDVVSDGTCNFSVRNSFGLNLVKVLNCGTELEDELLAWVLFKKIAPKCLKHR